MKVFFTAAEYDPFHNGHAYHIEQVRAAGATHFVAVMSPNFVQRGEPAVFDKFLRARAAVLGGADLVLELPLAHALSSAERFAGGAVEAALGSGICDGFTFGCETPDLERLSAAAEMMNEAGFQRRVREARRDGRSYPAACASVCGEAFADLFSCGNDLLAVEYIRALKKRGFRGEILPVKRTRVGHDAPDADGGIASAMYLRGLIGRGGDISPYVPKECAGLYAEALAQGRYAQGYERAVVSLLRAAPDGIFDRLPDAAGGFGDRLRGAVRQNATLTQIFDAAKTKRFTHASVRRAVYRAVLSVPAELSDSGVPYLRPLAFRGETAPELFHRIASEGTVPLLNRAAEASALDAAAKRVYDTESRATDIFGSFLVSPRACGADRTEKIFILGRKTTERSTE